jgi:hypothetical protein
LEEHQLVCLVLWPVYSGDGPDGIVYQSGDGGYNRVASHHNLRHGEVIVRTCQDHPTSCSVYRQHRVIVEELLTDGVGDDGVVNRLQLGFMQAHYRAFVI